MSVWLRNSVLPSYTIALVFKTGMNPLNVQLIRSFILEIINKKVGVLNCSDYM